MNELINLLIAKNVPYQTDVSASSLSLYQGGGMIKVAACPSTIKHLSELADIINQTKTPYHVIGGCSNILIKDSGYHGLAIWTKELKGFWQDGNIIKVGSAEMLPNVAIRALGLSLGGLECLAGIPGTIGGAVFMNAGAYGEEIKDVLVRVSAFDLTNGSLSHYSNKDIPWQYRSNGEFFKNKVITAVELKLTPKCAMEIEEKMCLLRRMRVSTQPMSPSLGCAFKKAGGISAGYYIEQVGLKGHRYNGASISKQHANFIINMGTGTAHDYIYLLELAQREVKKKFDINLQPEVMILG